MVCYIRTRQELQLPFMSEESPVRKAGLSLVSLDIKTFPCPYTKMRLETGDTAKAAKSLTEETRAWTNSSFLSGVIVLCVQQLYNKLVDFSYGLYFQTIMSITPPPKKYLTIIRRSRREYCRIIRQYSLSFKLSEYYR